MFYLKSLVNKTDFNSFHADYDTVTGVQIVCKITYIKMKDVAYFSENIMA